MLTSPLPQTRRKEKNASLASNELGGGYTDANQFKRRLCRIVVEMGFEELFVRFWWLIFPLLGFVWAFIELAQSGRRSKQAMDLIQTYVEHGKEPPSELLDIAAGGEYGGVYTPGQRQQGYFSVVISFTAIAVGFALASQLVGNDKVQSVFFVLACVFGVMAFGFFLMVMFGSRPQK